MNRILVLAGVVVTAAVVGWTLQHQRAESGRLMRENAALLARLADAAEEVAGFKARLERAAKAAAVATSNLPPEQFTELLRLRGEVTLLREQVRTQELAAVEARRAPTAKVDRADIVAGVQIGNGSLTLMEALPEYSGASRAEPPVVPSNGRVQWHHDQATGAPDTTEAGDRPTAWAPRNYRSGTQWLALGYDQAVEIGEINIHESYNPGAISKVAALMPDGSQRVLWEGLMEAGGGGLQMTSVPVPRGTTASQLVVYVDTDRVESWPEIDAVELVGVNGSRQWATRSSASSSYSETYGVRRE